MIELPVLGEEKVKKPSWLKVKLPTGENYKRVRKLVDEYKLHTICEVEIAQIWANAGAQVLPLL
jgi:lipoic acid synthetase